MCKEKFEEKNDWHILGFENVVFEIIFLKNIQEGHLRPQYSKKIP